MSSQTMAEIISVGTELLRGEITDTNAGYLASELPLLGVEVARMSTVGDSTDELCQAIRQGMERSPLVITSGGLGPTDDDLTRNCIASVLGEELAVDPGLEEQLRALFGRMGREMPPHNIRQAMLIPSAVALPNPRGTAPGWWVEKGASTIVALPGPPRELKPMWKDQVVPRLQARFPGEAILSRTVKTFTIAEAKVSELVRPLFHSGNLSVGVYAKPDGIHVRLLAQGDGARQALDAAEAELQRVLQPHVWGKDEDSLEGLVSRWLCARGLTLATMEDGTGGLLANMITEAGDSSHCYRGGLVARRDGAKAAWGVPPEVIQQHGAISPQAAEAMALAARDRFSADLGLSTTAIAAVDNPEGKPPGLSFIGIADRRGTATWQQSYPPSRGDARMRGAVAALFRLRERLIDLKLATS
jgi:nicotinamide-nucleotide amidase